MLGFPLLYSLFQMTIGLVTASSIAIRDNAAEPIRLLKFGNVLVYLARVASLAMTVGWLYREVSPRLDLALDSTPQLFLHQCNYHTQSETRHRNEVESTSIWRFRRRFDIESNLISRWVAGQISKKDVQVRLPSKNFR